MRSTATSTGRAIGGCGNCGAGNAVDGVAADTRSTCQGCGAAITLKLVYGNRSDQPCDGSCMSAIGPYCYCGCGGTNHGRWFLNIELVPVWEVDKAKAARAKRHTVHAKTVARREQKEADARTAAQRRRDALIEEHPTLVWLTYLGNLGCLHSGFLSDMRSALNRGEMSPRQVEAAVDSIDREFTREDAEAQRLAATAALAASGVRVPDGRVEVTGTVVSTRETDGYGYNRVAFKMLVVTDAGWKVWGTIPAGLLDAVPDASRSDRFAHGESYLAVHRLRGERVTFTATVRPSDDDPLFGFFSRPSGARLIVDVAAAA